MIDSSCQADATTSSSIVAGLVYLCGMEAGCYSCPRCAQRSMHATIVSEQSAIAETACQQAGINTDVARLERAPLFLLVDCAGRASRSPEASRTGGGKGGRVGRRGRRQKSLRVDVQVN